MMMIFGMFVFSVGTAAYQEFQRQTQWRHASSSRIGLRPARQFLGVGDDTITLNGTLLPEFTGGQSNLDQLRSMADQGDAWPLIEGTGTLYGLYVIESMSERKSRHFKDGAAQQIQFDLTLQRIDDDRTDQLGVVTGAALRAITGALA